MIPVKINAVLIKCLSFVIILIPYFFDPRQKNYKKRTYVKGIYLQGFVAVNNQN